MKVPELRTERLLLRGWRPSDLEPFARLNADPRVMEFFMRPLTVDECAGFIQQMQERLVERGFGWWAVEIPGVAECAGFVGLSVPNIETHFTPCVETGWRLAYEYWGHGYATEAARASVAFGFETVGLKEIVAFAVPANIRSRRVMEKIGMTHNPSDDFDHPAIPEGHPFRRHVLYRISSYDGARTR